MQKQPDSVLIQNGLIVTMDAANSVFYGDVLIQNGRIAEVGACGGAAHHTIDAAGMLVLPGFVQAHVHLCQVLFRGLADDTDVVEWLKQRIWPLESAHDEASIYASAMLGAAELIASGTTTVLSMETTRHTDSVFGAVEEIGLRAICGNAMMDVVEPGTEMRGLSTAESMAESRRLHAAWHGGANGRIGYAVMPRGARNCSPALVAEAGRFAEENGLLMHTHVSENGPLSARLLRETGMGDIELLDSQHIANERLVVAHAIHLNERDTDIVRQKGVKIVHCPSANMKLASGFCKVPELMAQGAQVSLGADGAPCNNNLDMLHEMRMAALVHKPRCGPTAMDASTVLRMATNGGAACLGLQDEIGSIEAGKKADIILLRQNAPHCAPLPGVTAAGRVVYSMKSCDVDTTIIDGKVLYRGGRFTGTDIGGVLANANTQLEKLLQRVPFGKAQLAAVDYGTGRRL